MASRIEFVMDYFWLHLILYFVAAGLGAYLGAYLKKKGENLATHEDINRLVDQVSVVTRTTKEIEAKISNDVWDRQKRWELKRDILFNAMKRIVDIDNALLGLDSFLSTSSNDDEDPNAWTEIRHSKVKQWSAAAEAFDETRTLVAVVCSAETCHAVEEFAVFASHIASKIAQDDDTKIYGSSHSELYKKILGLRMAVRKELGIDAPK